SRPRRPPPSRWPARRWLPRRDTGPRGATASPGDRRSAESQNGLRRRGTELRRWSRKGGDPRRTLPVLPAVGGPARGWVGRERVLADDSRTASLPSNSCYTKLPSSRSGGQTSCLSPGKLCFVEPPTVGYLLHKCPEHRIRD